MNSLIKNPTESSALEPPKAGLTVATVEAVKTEMRTMIEGAVADLRASIEAQNSLLQGIDVPLEAITESHERATESFETLRTEIRDAALESPALREIASSLEAAGLGQRVSRAEQNMDNLARRIEDMLATVSADMVKVLHLLERMQAREIREAKERERALQLSIPTRKGRRKNRTDAKKAHAVRRPVARKRT